MLDANFGLDANTRNFRRTVTPLTRAAALLAVAGVVAVGGIAGCEERESTKAIATAARKMETSAMSSGTAESLSRSLSEQAAALKSVSGDASGLPGEKAAASLMEAQAEVAKAESDASGLVPAEEEIRRKLGRAAQLSSLFALKSSTAKVAGDFDPSAQIGELIKSQQAKEGELAESRARLEVLSKELADLRARAKGELDAAAGHFREAASLKQSASSLSAQAGVTYIEQAAAAQRLGDARRLAGEQLQAQAEVLEPQVVEQQSIIKQQENQRQGLLTAQESLRTRQAESRTQAEEAREAASRIERDIESALGEAMSLRDSEFQPSFDKAKSGFERAVSLARGASTDPSSTAALTTAGTQTSLASLHLARAGLLGAMADTLDLLARTSPALSRSGEFASRAAQIRTERGEVIQAAAGALEAAKSAYGQAARIKDPVAKERLQQLGETIEKMRARLTGDAVDASGSSEASERASAPADGAGSAPSGDASPAATASESSAEIEGLKGMDPGARAALTEMVRSTREGRFDDLAAMTLAESDEAKALLALGTQMGKDFWRADKALRSKFSAGLSEVGEKVSNPMVGMALSSVAKNFSMTDDSVAGATFEGDAERVAVSMANDPEPTKLVKKDGAWLIDADLDTAASNPQAAMGAKAISAAAKKFADQVDAGAYATIEAAAEGLEKAMQEAFQELMKSMQSAPTGGG